MRHPFRAIAVSLIGSVLIAPLMAAHADLITDGGFETTQLGAGAYDYVDGTLNNWVYSAPSIGGGVLINVGGGSPWIDATQTGYGGDQVAGVQALGAISQVLNPIDSGTYSVSWLDAGRSNIDGGRGSQTYIASLYDDTTDLLVASTTLNTTIEANFNAESFSGLLNGGDTYTLSFTGQDSADETALIDNVSVNQVPEPATLVLFGTGLAGLRAMRRRKAI